MCCVYVEYQNLRQFCCGRVESSFVLLKCVTLEGGVVGVEVGSCLTLKLLHCVWALGVVDMANFGDGAQTVRVSIDR